MSGDPCAFSPDERQARVAAKLYASMFRSGDVVLDIGFGQGYFLEECREAGVRAIGVDRDPRLVSSARARRLEAHVGDVRELDHVVQDKVDGVVAAHLIEHLTPHELTDLLHRLAGQVRAGGHMVLVTPNFADWRVASEWFWLDPTHVRPYPSGAVRQLIAASDWEWVDEGFEPIRMTKSSPLLWLNRLRFGSNYGRPGRWYRLVRA